MQSPMPSSVNLQFHRKGNGIGKGQGKGEGEGGGKGKGERGGRGRGSEKGEGERKFEKGIPFEGINGRGSV